ncbi:ABC transporter ATP-binding protein [Pseudalkalibacillus caeni]|uniref:ATP-binding cassette domain-containing protein n=1 Tax=Exobacillus caeni TaxID=2574798 RepID=A0A5R9F0G0_9BACL|nr:ATP-binding cassette domain-containing protein [Pseudalkalibacillus caeni]TLS37102.1 ATP-binding cassette domain-containing protein [Pseudalkalibacillus caeni]
MSDYLIETNQLTKKFGNFKAVDSIDLKVKKGSIYGFLGPNGAGKSTTIRMLLGLIQPTSGRVNLFGKPLKSNRIPILKRVGSMVEYPSYYGHLTAYENLNTTRILLGLEAKEIDKVLEIVRLTEVKNKAVKKFSMGMKQRLGIANALLGNPELLILDEPTNGLDPSGIHEIRDLIKSLPKKMGITVLVSSHILSEIDLLATDVGIITKGKLVFQGSLEELHQRGKSQIAIEANPVEDAAAHLINNGFQPEIEGETIYLQVGEAGPAVLNKELVMNGFAVNKLAVERKTLEDIFLEVTKEGATA